MAAEIKPLQSAPAVKPIAPDVANRQILVSKIEGGSDDINKAVILSSGNAVMSICDDKSIRVWQRRDSGQYWPSICHFLPSAPTQFDFETTSRRLFLGLENGTVMEFEVAADYNSVKHKRDYLSHMSSVTGVIFTHISEWVLSISKDKFFVYYCTETGRRLGGHQVNGWCTALSYDATSKHVFIGDYSGQITMLKLEEERYQIITTLKGHNGSIRSLAWDPLRQMLFSGSYDQSIVVWDVGGGKGTAYELQGHTNKVTALHYASGSKQLLSGGEDSMIIFWDMASPRTETPEWIEADSCQYCERPFFWNLKAMVDQKQIGLRQHHCRKCGKAVCDSCSSKRSCIPNMGFEFDVRVCEKCFTSITDAERISMAKFHEVKHNIVSIDLDASTGLLLTVGQDRVMKLWDVSSLLN